MRRVGKPHDSIDGDSGPNHRLSLLRYSIDRISSNIAATLDGKPEESSIETVLW